MLTEKEQAIGDYLQKTFIPFLHTELQKGNPMEYRRWGGNACRQTAIFGQVLLEEVLPEYEWTAWDGNFTDSRNGERIKYNHAWVHGKHKTERRGVLVDLARLDKERLFISVKENKYPRNHPEYKNTRLLNKETLNVKEKLEEQEYYTNVKGTDLLQTIKQKMRFSLFCSMMSTFK
ncbi:hypothetical protein bcgnr5378_08160 [Bacillus cereus]|nr:hypothetical protein [Bacillus cereus]HDR8330547.1 hypothetical protein [Bacillus cereus]HDR8338119.1 hypothetical protein [Bacillus cereus]